MLGDALIFIPGIKGTKLVETNLPTWDTIWSGIQSNFETVEDLELTAALGGQQYEENIHSIIRPGEVETLAYGEFLGDLRTGRPIYIFNYDWRFSATENGRRLDEYLDYLQQKSRARSSGGAAFKKFDFVTHSLGNFVLRHYLHEHGFGRVNKVVFTVPPFRGSLDIVSAALIGEGLFRGVKAKIRKILRTMPGALELLPSYPQASEFVPKKKHNFFNFNHWQTNVTTSPGPIPGKMKKALSHANKTIKGQLLDLGQLAKKERDRILILVRGGYDTWQFVPVQQDAEGMNNFVDFKNGLRTKDGDGRVPHVSSCCYADKILTLLVEDDFWFREYEHGFFLKDERAQKLINRFLLEDTFEYRIPGGSVKRVTGLVVGREEGKPLVRVSTD